MRHSKIEIGLAVTFVVTMLAALAVAAAVLCTRPAKPQAAQFAPAATAVEVKPAEPAAAPTADDVEQPPAFHTGYTPPTDVERSTYFRETPKPFLRQAGPELFQARGPPPASFAAGSKKPLLLTRYLEEAHQKKFGTKWTFKAQGIGDCVSWGYANALNILLAIGYLEGRSGDFQVVATEGNYGTFRVEGAGVSSGGYRDGSSGHAAVRGLQRVGFVFRLDYRGIASDECDLRIYSAARAKAWGNFGLGGRDDRGRLDAEAKKHVLKQSALVTTFAEAVAAIENGYPVPVCFPCQAGTLTCDADGYCDPRGRSGGHCTCFGGVRYDAHGNPEGLLHIQSWGNCYRGGKYADNPDGTCWVKARVADSMLSSYRDSFAVSDIVNFPRQELRLVKGL